MWTMTNRGFYSAVQHRDDPALLVVRTRDRSDAESLKDWYRTWLEQMADVAILQGAIPQAAPDAVITAYEQSDYPWRVILPRTAYGSFMAEAVEDLDYGNFKDSVKANQGPERAHVYTNVWAALLRLEDLDPMGRPQTWENSVDDEPWDDYDRWEAIMGDATDEPQDDETLCPVCQGSGVVDNTPPQAVRAPWLQSDRPCSVCAGEGWVKAITAVEVSRYLEQEAGE